MQIRVFKIVPVKNRDMTYIPNEIKLTGLAYGVLKYIHVPAPFSSVSPYVFIFFKVFINIHRYANDAKVIDHCKKGQLHHLRDINMP